MDYEKKYKEALLKARAARQNTESAVTIGILEEIFPELKESEDEKIRKALLYVISRCEEEVFSRVCASSQKECIAWLKKQSEPTKINPSEFDLRLNKLLKQFESLPKEELISNLSYYLNIIQNNGTYKIEKQGEKKSITIDADPIASYDNVMISDIKDEGIDNISPEGSVNCVVTNSNKQGEQKPAWSEEDEVHINSIIDYLLDYKLLVYEEDMNVANGVQKELDWLNSTKQRIGG